MSFSLIKQIWQLKLPAIQQHVLIAMADYADDDGRNCFPSQPRLAWKTGYSERTVGRTIDTLIAMGIVKVLRPATNKAPPRYEICLDIGEMKAPFKSDNVDFRDVTLTPQSQSRDDSVTPQDCLGYQPDTSRDDSLSTRDDSVTPDPIINLSSNQPGNGSGPLPEKDEQQTAEETAQSWATCLDEIGAQQKTIGEWLQGSELLPTGRINDGKPLYQVLVVDAHHVEWIRDRAGRNIRWRLSTILGNSVDIEIISELPQIQQPFRELKGAIKS